MAVTDVIANIDALNGRTVRVAGYLGDCGVYDCRLFGSSEHKAESDRFSRELRAYQPGQALPTGVPPDALGIGQGENFEFDRRAAPYNNSFVVITGRVTNRCRTNGQSSCTDRSPDLLPTHIEHWSPPQSHIGNRT